MELGSLLGGGVLDLLKEELQKVEPELGLVKHQKEQQAKSAREPCTAPRPHAHAAWDQSENLAKLLLPLEGEDDAPGWGGTLLSAGAG